MANPSVTIEQLAQIVVEASARQLEDWMRILAYTPGVQIEAIQLLLSSAILQKPLRSTCTCEHCKAWTVVQEAATKYRETIEKTVMREHDQDRDDPEKVH